MPFLLRLDPPEPVTTSTHFYNESIMFSSTEVTFTQPLDFNLWPIAECLRAGQPAMLFGGGGSKPAEGGGEKKDGGFNMGNMMEGLKKANEIGQKTKDLQKVH